MAETCCERRVRLLTLAQSRTGASDSVLRPYRCLEVRDLYTPVLVFVLVAAFALLTGVAVEHFLLIRPMETRERARIAELVQVQQNEAQKLKDDALKEVESSKRQALLEAKEDAIHYRTEVENENREKRAEIQRLERRLAQKEENLDGGDRPGPVSVPDVRPTPAGGGAGLRGGHAGRDADGGGRRGDGGPQGGGALLPLVGWLGFAGVLQEEIWRRNR